MPPKEQPGSLATPSSSALHSDALLHREHRTMTGDDHGNRTVVAQEERIERSNITATTSAPSSGGSIYTVQTNTTLPTSISIIKTESKRHYASDDSNMAIRGSDSSISTSGGSSTDFEIPRSDSSFNENLTRGILPGIVGQQDHRTKNMKARSRKERDSMREGMARGMGNPPIFRSEC